MYINPPATAAFAIPRLTDWIYLLNQFVNKSANAVSKAVPYIANAAETAAPAVGALGAAGAAAGAAAAPFIYIAQHPEIAQTTSAALYVLNAINQRRLSTNQRAWLNFDNALFAAQDADYGFAQQYSPISGFSRYTWNLPEVAITANPTIETVTNPTVRTALDITLNASDTKNDSDQPSNDGKKPLKEKLKNLINTLSKVHKGVKIGLGATTIGAIGYGLGYRNGVKTNVGEPPADSLDSIPVILDDSIPVDSSRASLPDEYNYDSIFIDNPSDFKNDY